MNLLTQLEAASTAARQRAPGQAGVSTAKAQQLAAVRGARYAKAFALYSQLMQGAGWLQGTRIDRLLGHGHAGSRSFLRRLETEGVVKSELRVLDEKYITKPVRFYLWIEKEA